MVCLVLMNDVCTAPCKQMIARGAGLENKTSRWAKVNPTLFQRGAFSIHLIWMTSEVNVKVQF